MSLAYKIIQKIIYLSNQIRYNHFRKMYSIHPSFKFNGKDIKFYGGGELNIDSDSYIGSYSTIQIHSDHKVKIGKGCSLSHNVRIYTSSKLPDFDFKYKNEIPEKKGDVIIENYAWIGANVFINPGVTIGQNSVIGANSVVTKNIEANSIYGGVPAKLIRMKKQNV